MKTLSIIVAIAAGIAVLALRGWLYPVLPPDVPIGIPKGIPIAALAGRAAPQIGLIAPVPDWMPLPDNGRATGAALFPPQPPFGPGAVVMVKLDGSEAAFVASYRDRLARRGFQVRHLPPPFSLIIDAPDDQFEADARNGRSIFITLRGRRFAQLTFWDVPAPHM